MSQPSSDARPSTHRRSTAGRLGVALGFLSPALIAAGALAAKFGVLKPMQGFRLATFGPGAAALIGFGLGLAGLMSALTARPRGGLREPAIAVALCGLLLGVYAGWAAGAGRLPPIHDVATDWREPLAASPQLLAARGDNADPLERSPSVPAGPTTRAWAGQSIAQVNARACSSAAAVIRPEPIDRAFTRVRDAARSMGLKLVSDDVRQGRLEATATSFWFRFKDDLIVRVRPDTAGSRIDIRSVSREGQRDLGRNCGLVTKLRSRLAG